MYYGQEVKDTGPFPVGDVDEMIYGDEEYLISER